MFQVLAIVDTVFLITSIFMLILSTIPQFQDEVQVIKWSLLGNNIREVTNGKWRHTIRNKQFHCF